MIKRTTTPGQYVNVHFEHGITLEEMTAHLANLDAQLKPLLQRRGEVIADIAELQKLQQEDAQAAAAQPAPAAPAAPPAASEVE